MVGRSAGGGFVVSLWGLQFVERGILHTALPPHVRDTLRGTDRAPQRNPTPFPLRRRPESHHDLSEGRAVPVTVCCTNPFQVNQLPAVMEVLKGCQFIFCKTVKDKEERADILLNVANEFKNINSLDEAFKCALALLKDLPPLYYSRASKLSSNLLLLMATEKVNSHYVDTAIDVIRLLLESKIFIPSDLFSKIVNILLSESKDSVARELVQLAIESNWYVSNETTPTYIVLPSLVSSLEVTSLIRHHLLTHSTIRSLDIVCSSSKCWFSKNATV